MTLAHRPCTLRSSATSARLPCILMHALRPCTRHAAATRSLLPCTRHASATHSLRTLCALRALCAIRPCTFLACAILAWTLHVLRSCSYARARRAASANCAFPPRLCPFAWGEWARRERAPSHAALCLAAWCRSVGGSAAGWAALVFPGRRRRPSWPCC